MTRLPRWLGNLLSPAEDPRAPAPAADPAALLSELRRSRAELAQLRADLPQGSPVAVELAREEEALLEAERNLLASVGEQRARAALLRARRRTTEAELLADL